MDLCGWALERWKSLGEACSRQKNPVCSRQSGLIVCISRSVPMGTADTWLLYPLWSFVGTQTTWSIRSALPLLHFQSQSSLFSLTAALKSQVIHTFLSCYLFSYIKIQKPWCKKKVINTPLLYLQSLHPVLHFQLHILIKHTGARKVSMLCKQSSWPRGRFALVQFVIMGILLH